MALVSRPLAPRPLPLAPINGHILSCLPAYGKDGVKAGEGEELVNAMAEVEQGEASPGGSQRPVESDDRAQILAAEAIDVAKVQ